MTQKQNYPSSRQRVPAGFPSPAEEHIEDRISLSSYLNGHPGATFYVQLEGDSLIDYSDLLVVDRLLHVRSGDIVLANVNSEYTVKKLEITETGVRLLPGNKKYNPVEITEDLEFLVWGVVRGVARRIRQ